MKTLMLLAMAAALATAASVRADDYVEGAGSPTITLQINDGSSVLGVPLGSSYGAIDDIGTNTPATYVAGVSGSTSYRSYFYLTSSLQYDIDTGGVPGAALAGAQLQLEVDNVVGGPQTVDFFGWDGNETYGALGTGTLFGSQTYTSTGGPQTVTTTLNAAAVAAIAADGGGEILISAVDTTSDSGSSTPLPSTVQGALCLLGVFGAGRFVMQQFKSLQRLPLGAR